MVKKLPANTELSRISRKRLSRALADGNVDVAHAGEAMLTPLSSGTGNQEATIDRLEIYVTNAIKHFKFVPRGKIRLHQKPSTAEIRACRPSRTRGNQTTASRGDGRHGCTKHIRKSYADQKEARTPDQS
jgi:hypothetical protein